MEWKGNNNKPSAAYCISNALQLANEYPEFTYHTKTTFNDAWWQTFSVLPSNLLKSWNKGTWCKAEYSSKFNVKLPVISYKWD